MIDHELKLSSATIGIVTALPKELAAVQHVFACTKTEHVNGQRYLIGVVERADSSGAHIVVTCCLADMGNSSAAATTASLVGHCRNVRVVIMCGIAGAVPNPLKAADHVRLGDIVVTSKRGVVQYDNESVSDDATQMRPRWHTPSYVLLQAARQLDADERRGLRPWDKHIARALADFDEEPVRARWQRPPIESDLLCEFCPRRPFDYVVRVLRSIPRLRKWIRYSPIKHPLDKDRSVGVPKVFHGVVASADKLQRSPKTRELLRRSYDAMAIEMESSGIASAVHLNQRDFFVIRGTVDYCNEQKSDDWHHYGALIAAAYARSLLEITPGVLEWAGAQSSTSLSSAGFASLRGEPIAREVVSDGQATLSPSHMTVDPAQRELDAMLALSDEARHRISEVNHSLDDWELERATKLAKDLEDWVGKNNEGLPARVLKDIYLLLARVETTNLRQRRGRDLPINPERAEYLLGKAKSVGTKQ